jgi:hypothetical protein
LFSVSSSKQSYTIADILQDDIIVTEIEIRMGSYVALAPVFLLEVVLRGSNSSIVYIYPSLMPRFMIPERGLGDSEFFIATTRAYCRRQEKFDSLVSANQTH